MTTNTRKITAQLACELLGDNPHGVDDDTAAAVIAEATAAGVARSYVDYVRDTFPHARAVQLQLDPAIGRQLGEARDYTTYALRALSAHARQDPDGVQAMDVNVAHNVNMAHALLHNVQLIVSGW